MAKIVHMGMRANRPRQAQDATASNEQRRVPAQACTVEEVKMEIVSKESQDAIADVSVSWPSDMPDNKKKFEQKDLRERYLSAIGSSKAFSAKRTQLGNMSVISLTRTDSQAMEGAPIGSTLVSSPSEMMFVVYNWKRLPDQKSAVDFEKTRDTVLARTMECIRAAFPS